MMKILFVSALSVTVTLAGFCDEWLISGYHCDDTNSSKHCSCSSKKKSTKCEISSEFNCTYGCGFTGRCSPPPTPKPADEACATEAITEVTLLAVCPIVGGTYRTWMDKQESVPWLTEASKSITTDTDWWTVDLIPYMVEFADDNLEQTFANVQVEAPLVYDAWTTTCANHAKDFSCRRMIPECKLDKGSNDACMEVCPKLDECVDAVHTACLQSMDLPNNTVTNCTSYDSLFHEFIDGDGDRDCESLCGSSQNDTPYEVSPAAHAIVSMSAVMVAMGAMLLQ